MTNKNGVSNHSLLEISRKNLVGKVKSQSIDRYNKRLHYHATSAGDIDIGRFINSDMLVTKVHVGDYVCTIAFKGVIAEIISVLKSQPKPNVTLQTVIRAINRSIDKSDVLIDCTCADFKYRFAYYATKYGYKFGAPETRPPKKTNPGDNQGSMCKHITTLLSNKRWLVKLSSVVNDIVKKYDYEIIDKYNLTRDEFIINDPGRPSSRTMRNNRMISKNNEPDEELEPDVQEEV